MSKDIYFDRIESYVRGANPPAENRQFEKELEENPSLKAEYQAYLATQEAIGDLALDQVRLKVTQIAQQQLGTGKVLTLSRRAIAIAASLLLLIALLGLLYGRQQFSDQQLFAQQYEAPNWSPIRGTTTAIQKYDQALVSVQAGHSDEAIALLQGITPTDEVYANAQYALGHLHLQSKQPEAAAEAFETVEGLNDKRYQENVDWFLVLAYLQAGKEAPLNRQINMILQNEQHPYFEDAQSLQSRLQSFWRRF